ncbi:hypothetical protein GF377_01295 [candidate division GN15 bacterium]|nr:hypothetical protein [candidate division GN15 bacterium]
MTAQSNSLGIRLVRFAVGLICLALFAGFFASGITPPGVFGEVLRHNQAEDIDASPMVPSEVEHMAELVAGVKQLRAEAKARSEAAGDGVMVD